MSPFNLLSSTLPRLLLPLLAGMFVLTALHTAPQAAGLQKVSAHAYVMPPDDGYGITECMALGGACAQIVADAWCEAYGHAQAVSFGPVEDVTGAIAATASTRVLPEKGSFLVTCAE